MPWPAACSAAISRFFFYLRFDTWRSQAGTRVATTPSPTSPAAAVSVAAGHGRRPPASSLRPPSRDSMHRSAYGGSVLDFSGRGNRTARDVMDRSWRPGLMDMSPRSLAARGVSAYSNLGLDLSSSGPSGYRFRLRRRTRRRPPRRAAGEIREGGPVCVRKTTQDTKG